MSKDNQAAVKQKDREPIEKHDGASRRTDIEESTHSEQQDPSDSSDPSPQPESQEEPTGIETGSEGQNAEQAVSERPPSLEALTRMLETEGKKAEENWNALLRTQAEMENLRKRSARDLENAHKFGLDRFVSELLPVKDSLELGLAAASEDDGNAEVAQFKGGVELTLKMFKTALEKFGIEEVDPQGEAFNPDYHQAMSMQECEDEDSGTVLTVVQKGYLLNDRLVRPALVIVSKK